MRTNTFTLTLNRSADSPIERNIRHERRLGEAFCPL